LALGNFLLHERNLLLGICNSVGQIGGFLIHKKCISFQNIGLEILLICYSTLQMSNSWIEFSPAGYRWNACRRYARLVAWGFNTRKKIEKAIDLGPEK